MPKRKPKKDTRKKLIFKLALLLLSVYLVYSSISMQAQLASLNSELKAKQSEMADLQVSNSELKELLSKGSMDDIIERAARDKLGFVYANEKVYEDISGK